MINANLNSLLHLIKFRMPNISAKQEKDNSLYSSNLSPFIGVLEVNKQQKRGNKMKSIESIDGVEHSYWDKEWDCEDWIECGMSSQKYINLSDWVDNFNWTKKQEE